MTQLRLTQLRKKKHMNQAELAAELHVNQNTISRWERGDREPSIDQLKMIANYFNVSVSFLLGETNNPGLAPARDISTHALDLFAELSPESQSIVEKYILHLKTLEDKAKGEK